jgi:hypothetical protein
MTLIRAAVAAATILSASSAGANDLSVDGRAAVAVDAKGLAQAYLLVVPEWEAALSDSVWAEMSVRLEAAGGDTGIGDVSGFSPLSEPVPHDGADVRAEIDRLILRIEGERLSLDLGKQVLAWGSLDGIRITDQFNPVRLTEGLARAPRPDRIPIWAARLRARMGPVMLDLAASPDPTVNQLAQPGDRFFPKAPRFRGGFGPDIQLPELTREDRDRLVADGVLGARLSIEAGRTDLRFSALSGPEQQGVLRPSREGGVVLEHDRRTLFGAEFVRPAGDLILRAEVAFSPDLPVNLEGPALLDDEDRSQVLAGIGADFFGPSETFVNVQLLLDHIPEGERLIRPQTDAVATVSAKKRWADERWGVSAEWLQSLSQGDGLTRAELSRRVNDTFDLTFGADVFHGTEDGIFGQFREESRILIGVRF